MPAHDNNLGDDLGGTQPFRDSDRAAEPTSGRQSIVPLTVETGAGSRTTLTPHKAWTVGRSPDTDIVVDDSQVSRRHLVIESIGPAWVVRDVSTNGTWQAGTRIRRDGLTVPPGAQLRVNLGDRAGPELLILSGDPAGEPARLAPAGPPTPTDSPGQHASPGPAEPPGRRTKRRGRRLAVSAVVVVLLLVVADRVAAQIASTAAVSQIVQKSQGLTRKPTVSFGGFPFLNQVAVGKYTDISVGIDGIRAGSVRIEHIAGHLKGAHVPLSTAIRGHVSSIPVDHVTAAVKMRYTDLNAFLKDQPGHLTLGQRNGALQVSGSFDVGGETVKVSGSGRLGADGSGFTITPTSLHVSGGGIGGVLGGVTSSLGDLLSAFPAVPVPLPDLPFHLRLTSVRSEDDALVASAVADHVVLDVGNE